MSTLLRLARLSGLAVLLAAASLPPASPAHAQGRNVPNALQGFATNRDQPIRINANSLEVLDQKKQAIFSGNVVVVQGDTTLRCKELVVHYVTKDSDDKGKGGAAAGGVPASGESLAAGSPINSSAIRRLDINGSVVVTTKEQTATGDNGTFETASNTITLNGNPVVLTSGPNVIRGKKLTVDLANGMSRFDGGRIESLIVPNSMNQNSLPGGPAAGSKPAPKPAP